MQLPISEGGFGFPNLELYHYTYLLSSIKYWKPTIDANFLIWATLEYTYIAPLFGWTILGSKYIFVFPILKIGKKMITWKNWMEVGILTLDQLIEDEDEFFAYPVLRDKYHLPDVTQWQYSFSSIFLIFLSTCYVFFKNIRICVYFFLFLPLFCHYFKK